MNLKNKKNKMKFTITQNEKGDNELKIELVVENEPEPI